jgi:hypothetical protein
MTDFKKDLHPRDRRGRWRDALARALGPDPLGTGAASRLLTPPHHTGSTPSAEVAALRHLRPGQTVVLPHGTTVTRPLDDLKDPREFHVDVPRSTVARREEAVANGVPDAARPDLRDVYERPNDYRPPAPTVRRSGYEVPGPPPVPVDPGTGVIARSPGRAHRGPLPDGRHELRLTRQEAAMIADGLYGMVDAFGEDPDPAYDFFSRVAQGGDKAESRTLTVTPDTLNAALDAVSELIDPYGFDVPAEYERLSDKLHRAKYPPSSYQSPGRVRNAPTPGRPDKLYGPELAVLRDGDSVTSLRVRGSDVSEIRWRGGKQAASSTHTFASREEARSYVAERERAHAGEASPGRVTPHNASLGTELSDAEREHREALRDVAAADFEPGRRPKAMRRLDAARGRLARARGRIDDSLSGNALAAVAAQRSPGRAGPPRTRPRTVVEMTRADAGLVADEIGKLRMYGDGPSAPRDFFGQLARSGDPAERMSLRLGDSTYGVARDAMADAMERRRSDDVVRVARALHRGEQEASPGRAMPPLDSMSWDIARKLPARASRAEIEAAVEREASLLEPAARRELAGKVAERLNPDMPGYLNVGRDEPGRLPPPGVEASRGRVRRPPRTEAQKTASVLAAQRGPKPAPVGDIFTALNAAIATVRERRARTASPGRAQPEPNFPEGGLSIVSGGHRMGPYANWEQAAEQLLRERRAGSTAAHARAGLRADRDLSPEQARYLVELAAKRALAAQEAARRDREQLAAIILRG